jgi:hypothetical protein
MSTTEYIIRKEGTGTFGIGQEVAPNCVFFKAGDYGLTKEELTARIAAKQQPQPKK